MNIEVNDKGIIELKEVFNPLKFITRDGETLILAMRDSGFEITYEDNYFELKNGDLTPSPTGEIKQEG